MTAIKATALTPIKEYKGPCTFSLSKRSLAIKTDDSSTADLGTWPYECIRRFHSQDLNFFSFTSGRRGPYGVADYKFRINEHELLQLQKLLTQYTGAKFDPPRSNRTTSDPPTLSPKLYPHHNTVPRHIPYSQTNFSLPSSPSPNQPGYSTTHILSPSHDASSPDEGLKENLAYQRSDSPRSGGSPQSLRHSFKRRSGSESPKSDSLHDSGKHDSMFSLPGVPSHLYEDADMIQTLTSDYNGQSGYDKLEKAREEAKVINGITPLSIEQQSTDSTVEKRIKSLSPKPESESPPLSPPLTDTEIRQLKRYNREPLINKSATIHDRRKADYTYIELSDSSSECGGDSRPTSIYDIPTRLASQVSEKLYDIPQSQSIYDVPPPPRPTSNGSSHTSSIYDIPRSSVRDSVAATQRALPHLPTDYVNIQLGNINPSDETYCEVPAPNRNITQSKSMINVYHDIPEHNLYSSPSDTALRRVESDQTVPLPGQKLAQNLAEEEGYVLVSPATRPVLITTPPPRSHSTPGQHDVQEQPMNDEYIEVRRNNSATNLSISSGTWTKRGKDGYDNVEVIPIRPVPSAPELVIDHDYVNFPINVRKWSDGYEEVKELRSKFSVSSDTTSESDVIITTTEPDTTVDLHDLSLSPTQLMSTEYMHTNDIHDTQDNAQDNTNVLSSIQSTPSEEGASDNPLLLSGDPPNGVTIPEKTMIPIALGSPEISHMLLARKRSLTVGDPLDGKEAKKHTYENVPEDQYPPGALPPRSYTNSGSTVTKKPMPLPRPATLSAITLSVSSNVSVEKVNEKKANSNNECQQASLSLSSNSNHNNNKVKMLIQQFSDN